MNRLKRLSTILNSMLTFHCIDIEMKRGLWRTACVSVVLGRRPPCHLPHAVFLCFSLVFVVFSQFAGTLEN